LLYDGDGTMPAIDNGTFVGKENRRTESRTRRNGRPSRQAGYKGKGLSGSVQRRHKRPYGGSSGRIKVLWRKYDSLPSIVSGLSIEVEGWPRRN
jgi:hypothetical protein